MNGAENEGMLRYIPIHGAFRWSYLEALSLKRQAQRCRWATRAIGRVRAKAITGSRQIRCRTPTTVMTKLAARSSQKITASILPVKATETRAYM
jgi:hypothetical protein